MKNKKSAVYILFLGLALSFMAITPAHTAHKALSWGDITGFFKYIGSIPDKIDNALNDANEVVEKKYADIEDTLGGISANVFSTIASADTPQLSKELNLGKISQVSTKEGGKIIAKNLLNFADVLKPAAETLGALTADVPDEIGVAEAWIDFKGSAFFASTGATLAGGLALAAGATASAPVLAVGGIVGAIVYNLTGDKATDAAGDALADRMSDETGAHKAERRAKCVGYQKQIEKDPKKTFRVNAAILKQCLKLGVNILRSKNCTKTTRWHKFLQKCATRNEFINYCKNKYPGSFPRFASPRLCECRKGKIWNKRRTQCIVEKKGLGIGASYSGKDCPQRKPGNTSKKMIIVDNNKNTNDRTYLACAYNRGGGRIFSDQLAYVNGIKLKHTRWADSGPSFVTDFYKDGRKRFLHAYSRSGKLLECKKFNRSGKMIRKKYSGTCY